MKINPFVFVDSHFFAPVIDYLAILRVKSTHRIDIFCPEASVIKWWATSVFSLMNSVNPAMGEEFKKDVNTFLNKWLL